MDRGLAPTPASQGKEGSSPVASFPCRYVRFREFQLDWQRRELLRDGSPVKVQGKVYQVLAVLLENAGEIVTRETLRMRLWPMATRVNYDANVNTTVNKLRQVLGDTNESPLFVETIPRKGYSFIAKVEYLDEQGVTATPRGVEAQQRSTSLLGRVHAAMFLGADRSGFWFTAGVIALLIAAMLLGAAITLYSHRSF
jgi:DNA-binding winged helix-turn-helix (wHTH) protein